MMKLGRYTLTYSTLHCGLIYSATYVLPFLVSQVSLEKNLSLLSHYMGYSRI